MKAGLVLVALLALVACGDPDPTSSSPSSTSTDATAASADGDDEPMAGDPSGTWVLVDGPVPPIPGWDVTMTIEGDRIGGTAACNGYGGTIVFGDGSIAVDELSWTEMGCEPAVHDLEQAFLTALPTVTAFEASGDRLALVTADGTWRFDRLAEVPTAELVGTTWVVDGYIVGDTVSNEAGMEHAFVELFDDGSLVGATNCRRLSGTWVVSGAEVVFTSFAADGDCPLDQLDLDGRILTVLGDGFRPVIDGDRMTATSQGGEALTFRAGDRPAPPEPLDPEAEPDPAGGVDGPVACIAETDIGEAALLEARLEIDGECLYANGDDAGRPLLLWSFGTTWQADPPAVVSPLGSTLLDGDEFSAGGGFHGVDAVPRFAGNPAVTAYVTGCGADLTPDGIFIIQHPDFVGPRG